jgi:uncharacterized cupredoxin-like copper-binding protein
MQQWERFMRRTAIILLVAALPVVPALAGQSIDWDHAQSISVEMSNFMFMPKDLTLRHGTPYRLHLTNISSGGHDFAAKEFFDSVTVAPEDRARIKDGKISLGGGESADIRVVPNKPGSFKIKCTHFMHTTFGMTGSVVVQ